MEFEKSIPQSMKYFNIIIMLVLWNSIAKCQILNAEKDRFNSDSTKLWLGETFFGISLYQQQGRITDLNLSSNVAYFSQYHIYMLFGNLHFIKARGDEVSSNGYLHFRLNFLQEREISYEIFTQIQYDVLRGMRERILSGINIRYQIVDAEEITAAAGTGLMYEYEQWTYQENQANTYLIKNSTYLSLRYDIKKDIFFSLISYYQARYDRLHKPRISVDCGISVQFSQKLSFTSKFLMLYDTAPILPIEKLTYNFNNGFALRF